MTVHFVTEGFNRVDAVMATVPLHASHTGVYLANVIRDKLERFEVNPSHLVALVRDGASNMVAVGKVLRDDYPHMFEYDR